MRPTYPKIDESKYSFVDYWHNSGLTRVQTLESGHDGKWGIIDVQERWTVQPTYDELWFNEGRNELTFIRARKGLKWGFIDAAGREVIPFKFDGTFPFVGNHAPAAVGDKWGPIDIVGDWALDPQYDEVQELSDKAAAVRQGQLWGVVDYSGKWLIEPRFHQVGYCQGRDFTLAEHMFEPEDSATAKEFEGALGGLIQSMDQQGEKPKDK